MCSSKSRTLNLIFVIKAAGGAVRDLYVGQQNLETLSSAKIFCQSME